MLSRPLSSRRGGMEDLAGRFICDDCTLRRGQGTHNTDRCEYQGRSAGCGLPAFFGGMAFALEASVLSDKERPVR
jgi:hypothetical protein